MERTLKHHNGRDGEYVAQDVFGGHMLHRDFLHQVYNPFVLLVSYVPSDAQLARPCVLVTPRRMRVSFPTSQGSQNNFPFLTPLHNAASSYAQALVPLAFHALADVEHTVVSGLGAPETPYCLALRKTSA